MQMYIHIFTQIQLRLNRCDPAEWIGNKIELPASPTVTAPHGMGKHMNYCHHLQIVSIVSGDMTLKTFFSARTITALLSVSSFMLFKEFLVF